MYEFKKTVANNIAALRTNSKLTQAELAEKLGYSDKSISKWERAEALPDVYVLKTIADIFDVTVDYIITPHQASERVSTRKETAKKNHALITLISIIGLFLLSTVAFTAVWIATGKALWLIFVDTVPVAFIVLLVFNSLWFKKHNNLYIISLLIWSILSAFYLSLLITGIGNYWLVFIIGIPAQIVTVLCFGIKVGASKKRKK